MAEKIKKLEEDLFHPRMEFLQAREIEFKDKLIQLTVSENKFEVNFYLKQAGLICTRDLQIWKVPTTLVPCGHTFCRECVDTIREENFQVLKCKVCQQVATSVFRNEQLEHIIDRLNERRLITESFLGWIKNLLRHHPEKP